MKLSKAEHKIKKKFAEKELQPSANLWNAIQQELDQKESKPKVKYLWWKLGSVAAVFCLAFLAYQGFQKESQSEDGIAISSKPAQAHSIELKAKNIDFTLATNVPVLYEKPSILKAPENSLAITAKTLETSPNSININDEVDQLLAQARKDLSEEDKEAIFNSEVDKLLEEAMASTDDVQQKNIIKNMKARLLLAEIETEIELEKPPLLKDKIWEAVVSNLNDLKSSLVLN